MTRKLGDNEELGMLRLGGQVDAGDAHSDSAISSGTGSVLFSARRRSARAESVASASVGSAVSQGRSYIQPIAGSGSSGQLRSNLIR